MCFSCFLFIFSLCFVFFWFACLFACMFSTEMKKEGVMLDEWGGGENQEGDEEKKTDQNIFFEKRHIFN